MSFYLSKEQLYREQPFYSSAKSHDILPSSLTSTSVLAESLPTHVLAIPVSNATQDIDILINRAQFKILDAWVIKNTVAAAAGDDLVIKHIAQDGTTITDVGTFTSLTFMNAFTAGSRRQDVPNMPGVSKIFADRCKLRISATSATNCGCTVYLKVGLV